jgi:type IV secretory pathway TrbD component
MYPFRAVGPRRNPGRGCATSHRPINSWRPRGLVKVGTPRFVKLKAGLLAGLVIVVLTAVAAWLYFLARLAWNLATWIFS